MFYEGISLLREAGIISFCPGEISFTSKYALDDQLTTGTIC